MTTTRNAFATSLVLGSLVASHLALAAAPGDELPAQPQRLWAPRTDYATSYLTAGWQYTDIYGDRAKLLEDWQVGERYAAFGLFGARLGAPGGLGVRVAGAGATEATGRLDGRVRLVAARPGRLTLALEHSGFQYFFDRDSERRDPDFPAPPPPPTLADTPALAWARCAAAAKVAVVEGLNLTAAASQQRRDGQKGSLARGEVADAPPRVLDFDTRNEAAQAGADFTRGALAARATARYAHAEGVRAHDDGLRIGDDQDRYEGRLGLAYDLGADTRLVAHGALYRLESAPREAHDGARTPVEGDCDVRTAQLAVLQRLGGGLNLRVSALLQAQDIEAFAGPRDDIAQGVDRERTRQEVRVGLTHAGLARTALRLQYRYRATDLEEALGLGGLPGFDEPDRLQQQDQERTSHDVSLAARYAASAAVKIRARLDWRSDEVEQTRAGDALRASIGDYTRDRVAWQLSVPCRLGRTVLLDVGHQGLAQTYEAVDEGVESSWDAVRGFANVNWLATDRITVYGGAAVGLEQYELAGGRAPSPGFAPFNYDGLTWRLTPGAVVQLTPRLSVEGALELISFTEDADESGSLAALESDHDRILARLQWQATEAGAFSLTYQRREFDENRWDDTIVDRYTVAFTGTF